MSHKANKIVEEQLARQQHAEALQKLIDTTAATAQPMPDTDEARLAVFCGYRWDGHYWHAPDGDVDAWTPTFFSDLNLCAQAEARVVEMGRGPEYIAALFQVVSEMRYPDNPFMQRHVPLADREIGPDVAHVATASAEARCRAMLRVIGI